MTTTNTMNRDEYHKFLSEEIDVAAGRYTRAQLIGMSASLMDIPAVRLVPVFPVLRTMKLTGSADVMKAAPVAETPPWEETAAPPEPAPAKVDDRQMIESLLSVTWSKAEAPRGKPCLRHVFEVIAWLKADDKRAAAVDEALNGPSRDPKQAKNLGALSEIIGRSPVWDSARWLFAVWTEHVSASAFRKAWSGSINDFVTELWNFGLDMDGLIPGGEASHRAYQHSFMPAIIEGTREDGVYKKTGSCAAVMKAMKMAFDALPADKHAQMYDHIMKNYDADKIKAMAPLLKILNSKGQEEAGTLVCQLLSSGDVPVAVLAMVFQDEWDRLYTSLRSCLDTVGPIPPWLKASVA